MLRKVIDSIHPRSLVQYKNISLSIIYRGISLAISFLLLPLSLSYLAGDQYGIWLTVSSILGWFGFFDLGLGNGLKNKLAEALAKKDYVSAKTIISTSYISLCALAFGLTLVFVTISLLIDWDLFFQNSNKGLKIHILIATCVTFFAIKLILDLLNSVLLAYQKTSYVNLISTLANLLTLLTIYLLTRVAVKDDHKLLIMGIVLTGIPVLTLLAFSMFLFKTAFKDVRPSFQYFNRAYIKEIASLGGQFFVLQLSVLIIFSTDNILIARILNPGQVTVFNIAFKLFSAFTIIWAIIITPYWTAFSESYNTSDFSWIKKTLKLLLYLWLIMNLALIVLGVFINDIIELWLGEKILIPVDLTVTMALYISISTFGALVSSFINGTGKIRLQLYLSVLAAVINIPLAIYFARNLNLGMTGIMLSNCISLSIGAVACSYQTYKLVNSDARGIWSK